MNNNAMDWATHNLAVGFCDTETLGREFCKEWKQKQIIVLLNPGLKDTMATRQPSCPANLIWESDFHNLQQEILKRYATTDVAADAIKIIFQPEKEIPYLPRAGFDLKGTGSKPGTGFLSKDDMLKGLTTDRLVRIVSSGLREDSARTSQPGGRGLKGSLRLFAHEEL